MGMVERKGRARAKVVPNVQAMTLVPEIETNIKKGTRVITDDLVSCNKLGSLGYEHHTVPHSKKRYIVGKDIHTNAVEGFWSQLKRSIDGSYHHVTPRYLQLYVDEYGFRYTHRNDEQNMFITMLERVVEAAAWVVSLGTLWGSEPLW